MLLKNPDLECSFGNIARDFPERSQTRISPSADPVQKNSSDGSSAIHLIAASCPIKEQKKISPLLHSRFPKMFNFSSRINSGLDSSLTRLIKWQRVERDSDFERIHSDSLSSFMDEI